MTVSFKIKNVLGDFRFWIFIFFLIRLVGITNPPLEVGHNWRQVTGLMVARNFLEVDNNIFYPRIDETGSGTGIIGMEFPLLNYLVYLVSLVFGYEHWYGRLINLIVSSIGVLFFYKSIKDFFGKSVAFNSGILLLSSIWFAFSRKMMPDTFSISLAMVGVYYVLNLFYHEYSPKKLLLFFLFFTLGGLAKIPAAMFGVLIIIPFFDKKNLLFHKLQVAFLMVVSIIIIYGWYFKWNIFLAAEYGSWYNSGKTLSEGFLDIRNNLKQAFSNFYFHAFRGYLAFPIFLLSIFYMFYKRNKSLIAIFLLFSLIYVVYIIKSGFFFYHHQYYIIPFVPIMAFYIGYLLDKMQSRKAIYIILALLSTEAIANQQHDFFIKPEVLYKLDISKNVDNHINKNELVGVVSDGNPQLLYLSGRKGWLITENDISNNEYLNKLKQEGCAFIIYSKKEYNIQNSLDIVFEDGNFVIFSMK